MSDPDALYAELTKAMDALRTACLDMANPDVHSEARGRAQIASGTVQAVAWELRRHLTDPASAAPRIEPAVDQAAADQADLESNLLAHIRRALDESSLSEADPQPLAVVFDSDEWDDGWYYSPYATLVLADGTRDRLDLSAADATLTELCAVVGGVGRDAGLVVTLDGGKVEYDTYLGNLLDALPADPNAQPTGN